MKISDNKTTKEGAITAQSNDKRVHVTSDTYPAGLVFEPWECFNIFFVGHKNINYYIID